jgi:hypothetical protein
MTPMYETDGQHFITFMKIIASMCLVAMILAVWPGAEDDE